MRLKKWKWTRNEQEAIMQLLWVSVPKGSQWILHRMSERTGFIQNTQDQLLQTFPVTAIGTCLCIGLSSIALQCPKRWAGNFRKQHLKYLCQCIQIFHWRKRKKKKDKNHLRRWKKKGNQHVKMLLLLLLITTGFTYQLPKLPAV